MTTFNPPANMEFNVGSTEQKMDMTLDDIIKLTKKSGRKQRLPIKSSGKGQHSVGTRAALQRSVAARSSKMRQGKLAEARSRNGAGNLAATQAAGKRAFATPVNTRGRQRMKGSDGYRRPNFKKQRVGLVPNSFGAAAGSMKISVVNESSKNGIRRYTVPFRRRNNAALVGRQVMSNHSTDQMDVSYTPIVNRKPRTLDSLFASINEQRRYQRSQAVQPFTSVGRGSRRGGFAGRRRQGGQ